jgi:FecR protein
MSDPDLDGLARTLAQPMPRRRAVRVMAVGFVAAAFPALRPRRAVAQGGCGPSTCQDLFPGYKCCPLGQCCPGDAYCCAQTRECCPAGEVCLDKPGSVECCLPERVCGAECCPADYECRGGECIFCEACEGSNNRFVSVETASGDDLGLTGKQMCRDQEVVAQESTRIHLSDGSVITLEAGNGWKVRKCAPDETIFDLIGDKIIKLFAGDGKFNLETDRAIIGVRGTEFSAAYNRRKKRTTVKVKSGKLQVWARRSPKKKVTARKGDTVIQQGNESPRIKG